MKRERCSVCDELTGRAGRGEDSLFWPADGDDLSGGPLCESCFHELQDRQMAENSEHDRIALEESLGMQITDD